MVHRNARLTPAGRGILVQRVLDGRPGPCGEGNGCFPCQRTWALKRYGEHGLAGMEDRSSRPRSCRHATPEAKIDEVLAAREKHREGPVELVRRRLTSEREPAKQRAIQRGHQEPTQG